MSLLSMIWITKNVLYGIWLEYLDPRNTSLFMKITLVLSGYWNLDGNDLQGIKTDKNEISYLTIERK
jgi:hypothetical protein